MPSRTIISLGVVTFCNSSVVLLSLSGLLLMACTGDRDKFGVKSDYFGFILCIIW